MPQIYFRLHVDHNYFYDEEMDVELSRPNRIAGVLDYTNLDEGIINGLNNNIIVQITQEEYYGIISDPPPKVPTDFLITLDHYFEGCPPEAAIFFAYYDKKWWQILYSDLKDCMAGLGGGISFRKVWRVGLDVTSGPQAASNTFDLPELIGKKTDKLMVLLNGVEIYHADKCPDTDTLEHYEVELDGSGEIISASFTRPLSNFSLDDILALTIF